MQASLRNPGLVIRSCVPRWSPLDRWLSETFHRRRDETHAASGGVRRLDGAACAQTTCPKQSFKFQSAIQTATRPEASAYLIWLPPLEHMAVKIRRCRLRARWDRRIQAFAKTKEEREAANDSRLSLMERYKDRNDYVNRIRTAALRP